METFEAQSQEKGYVPFLFLKKYVIILLTIKDVNLMVKIFKTSDFNIDNTGNEIVTSMLQKLIDEAAMVNGKVIVEAGIYQTAALFLKSNIEFYIEKDAQILGTIKEDEYNDIFTRVAGIEMMWYPGIINCIDASNVTISGEGTINGNGPYWWDKYWGSDTKGGMRKTYDENGLRFACDYDCKRVRNILISNSKYITLKNFTSFESGFWNVHVLYSNDIHIDGIKIESRGLDSPSTDGIDIDSCYNVLIENCITNCNDDSICIKSGRDFDGIRVNRPCHDITIQNCTILSGFGVTIGSEISGGVYNIKIRNLKYKNTDCGFRIKSSKPRKGYIKDILFEDIEMINVKYLFHIYLNWNPAYSICKLPADYKGQVPSYWETLLKETCDVNTKVENIMIKNVNAYNMDNYDDISRAFNIEGFKDSLIDNIIFENVNIISKEYGIISYVKNIKFNNFKISVSSNRDERNDNYDNR